MRRPVYCSVPEKTMVIQPTFHQGEGSEVADRLDVKSEGKGIIED